MGSVPRSVHDGLAIVNAGIQAVQPDRLIESSGCLDAIRADIEDANRVFVVGAGKASLAMASVVEHAFGSRISGGSVVVPEGYVASLPRRFQSPSTIHVSEAGHPIPDGRGVAAARRALEIAFRCEEGDLLLVLISGGASSLWSGYAPGISLDDAAQTTSMLLDSGATIQEINTVRKHISSIGGGRLIEIAGTKWIRALVISDVIGDDPSFVGSGPCSPDETTYSDALVVLIEHGLEAAVPDRVLRHLQAGADGLIPESPQARSEYDERSDVWLIGTNQTAVKAMSDTANDVGYKVEHILDQVAGEARVIGREVAHAAAQLQPGSCFIWGGESTVHVTGSGIGGRNHELALAAAIELGSANGEIAILSAGTDGIDGAVDAAGAWVDSKTVQRGNSLGVDARISLANNDSGSFFARIGQQIVTGPTHTNVMDVGIAIRPRGGERF